MEPDRDIRVRRRGRRDKDLQETLFKFLNYTGLMRRI